MQLPLWINHFIDKSRLIINLWDLMKIYLIHPLNNYLLKKK